MCDQSMYLETETKISNVNYRTPKCSVESHNTGLNGATGHITVLIRSMSCNQGGKVASVSGLGCNLSKGGYER
jgi:hypothetical protein